MCPRPHIGARSVAWYGGDSLVGISAPCLQYRFWRLVVLIIVVVVAVSSSLLSLSLYCRHRCRRCCRVCCHRCRRLVIVVFIVIVVVIVVVVGVSLLASRFRCCCWRRLIVVVIGVSAPGRHCCRWRLIWQFGWSNVRVWKTRPIDRKYIYYHFSWPWNALPSRPSKFEDLLNTNMASIFFINCQSIE